MRFVGSDLGPIMEINQEIVLKLKEKFGVKLKFTSEKEKRNKNKRFTSKGSS